MLCPSQERTSLANPQPYWLSAVQPTHHRPVSTACCLACLSLLLSVRHRRHHKHFSHTSAIIASCVAYAANLALFTIQAFHNSFSIIAFPTVYVAVRCLCRIYPFHLPRPDGSVTVVFVILCAPRHVIVVQMRCERGVEVAQPETRARPTSITANSSGRQAADKLRVLT